MPVSYTHLDVYKRQGVNMGRDTDCVAAVAGGIAGALSGSESIPADWILSLIHI